jgi:hypothetical protein
VGPDLGTKKSFVSQVCCLCSKEKDKKKKEKKTHRILYLLLVMGTTSLPLEKFEFWEFQIEFSRVLTAEK